MSCKLDIKNAILDEAFKTEINGRYSYKRVSQDTLEITNETKSKAKNNSAALKKLKLSLKIWLQDM